MQKKELIAVILVILSTLGAIIGIFGYENYRRKKHFTVELIARAPENGNWYCKQNPKNPRQIRVPSGRKVTLLIRNIDTVTHGFAIPDLGVPIEGSAEIKAGEVKKVTFTPQKKGVFPFMCTVWCSMRHMEMTGELIVE
jgi:heme/copper-type cytochrome/quinol oxidase subunit 2